MKVGGGGDVRMTRLDIEHSEGEQEGGGGGT